MKLSLFSLVLLLLRCSPSLLLLSPKAAETGVLRMAAEVEATLGAETSATLMV
jgi:hypothetical protein